jgi:polyhydroxybutyrate depolymerase
MRVLLAAPTGLGPLAVGCLLWATAPAHAQQLNLEQRFRQLDRDGDGRLSAEEAAVIPALAQWIAAADGDGTLTIEEMRARLRRAASPPQRVPPPPDGNVSESEHTLPVDGRQRSFIVQAPAQPKGKLPVVFFFHGGGGRARNVSPAFRNMVARGELVAVYPQGWKNNWNDGRQGQSIPAQVEGVDDVRFVRAIVEDLAKHHPIDPGRIFATGASNGGIFSHCLAARAADLFVGIAPVIGGLAEPLAAEFRPTHPISLLVIQGDADRFVPIEGGPIMGSGRRGRVIATEEVLSKYLAHNGISADPEITQLPDKDPEDGTVTEVRRYPPGTEGVRVEYYLVRGGGHTMPGSGRGQRGEALVGKTSRDFDGPETIWSFLKSCPPRRHQDAPQEQPVQQAAPYRPSDEHSGRVAPAVRMEPEPFVAKGEAFVHHSFFDIASGQHGLRRASTGITKGDH